MPAPPSLGLVEHLVADPTGGNWLLSGSSRGYLCLWDVRFRLAVNSWQLPQRCVSLRIFLYQFLIAYKALEVMSHVECLPSHMSAQESTQGAIMIAHTVNVSAHDNQVTRRMHL